MCTEANRRIGPGCHSLQGKTGKPIFGDFKKNSIYDFFSHGDGRSIAAPRRQVTFTSRLVADGAAKSQAKVAVLQWPKAISLRKPIARR